MADAIDDDTERAVLDLWRKTPALGKITTALPMTGRLKSPQQLPYGQTACELDRRDLAGTAGAWHDYRKVTLTIYGVRADAVAALQALGDVFNRGTVLVFPSGALFRQWWPLDGGKLVEDPASKSGLDVWQAIVTGRVWSIRLQ